MDISDAHRYMKKNINNTSVIYDTNNDNILAITPKYLIEYEDKMEQSLNDMLQQDNVSCRSMYEGTIITAYKYANGWGLATRNSYDVSNMIFAGDKTYVEIIWELAQLYPDFVTHMGMTFNDGVLDFSAYTSQQFTFGFHHEEYHPTRESNHMWSLQDDIRLPAQARHDINTIKSVADLRLYIKKTRYGVIINDEIIFSTRLMKFIKQSIYDFPKDRSLKNYIDNHNRWHYQIIRYIGFGRTEKEFKDVFTKLIPLYDTIKNVINNIVSSIIHGLVLIRQGKPYSDPMGNYFISHYRINGEISNPMANDIQITIKAYVCGIDTIKTLINFIISNKNECLVAV